MIKEAIEKILTLSTPNTIDYEGRKFVDKAMTPLPRNLKHDIISGFFTVFIGGVHDFMELKLIAKLSIMFY